ncbi:hypothetical protein BDW02DRAFT_486894 [Decorospora gaudefroyi]|uniref:Uncharacterized protein n=1 Tax=Decorospora gaudefroyi TaxID=184978 RepID=A0A6A5KVR5_9PLEO|nr:hypothetical protein BDW02DRAFT_486894 [Decorospora gaudefroyi]
MTFKSTILKLRHSLLCCNKHERRPSLDIVRLPYPAPPTLHQKPPTNQSQGSPTNVRHIDISDALPGLTETQRAHIREKASADAIRLLSLHSHPPTAPPSPTNPSTASSSLREPSTTLLNAASKDLPHSVPTPPRRTHKEDSPPAIRMRSMWESEKKDSREATGERETSGRNASFSTLNLEFFDWEDDKKEGAGSGSLCDGIEALDTVGGHEEGKMGRGLEGGEGDESSDSEADSFVVGERKPLVKC